ncbi:MAG: glycosyltransferase family 4 protein [Chloroflexi bacterium]|nr:glycosyltransferase family 4 protein [Chloroflexota bacterium]
MKVLMISKACYVATYRRKLEELAAYPDIELTLIVPPYWLLGKGRALLESGYDQGYHIIIDNPRFNGKHHFHYYPHLQKYMQAIRPDILHIDEEPYNLVAWHALRVGQRLGAKTIFFTWQNIYHHYPPPLSFFESYAFRHAHAAIAGSQEAAGVLRAKGYFRPLFVIPQFGIDPQLYEGAAPREPRLSGPLRIGYVGRLVTEKGIPILLQAVAGLEGDWELRLLGDGPLREESEREALKLGIEKRTIFLGSVPSTKVAQHLGELDVLVLPSITRPRWKEQFGRVLVEAMACGIPVIGSDSGEIPHVIGDAGLIFREGEAIHLRQQLQLLITDIALRRQLAQRGRERLQAHFTQKKVAADTHKVYEMICETQSADLEQP